MDMESRKRKVDEDGPPDSDIPPSKIPATIPSDETPTNTEKVSFPVPTLHLSAVPSLNNQTSVFGFASYSKSNPFQTAVASSGGVFSTTADKKEGEVDAPSHSSKILPPLALPSPYKMTGLPFGALPGSSSKSPKGTNPFSSASPAHNPFVTIVDNKDILWKAMATGDRSGLGQFSSGFGADKDASEYISRADGDDDSPVNDNVEYDPDIAYQKIVSLPENVPVFTGEESEHCAFQVRAKLFRLSHPAAETMTTPPQSGSEEQQLQQPASEQSTLVTTVDGGGNGANIVTYLAENASSPGPSSSSSSSSSGVKGRPALEWVEVAVGPLKLLMSAAPTTSQNKRHSNGGKVSKHSDDDEEEDEEDSNDSAHGGIDSCSSSYSAGGDGKAMVSARLVMRREDKKGGSGTKLLLNARLDQYATAERQSEKIIRILCVNYCADITPLAASAAVSGDAAPPSVKIVASPVADRMVLRPNSYLIKTKSSEDSVQLLSIINKVLACYKSASSS